MDFKHVEMNQDDNNSVEYEVAEVWNHRVVDGIWSFGLRWKGSKESEFVDDVNCNCDSLISEYLKKNNIHTVYCVCRVSSKTQTGPTHVSLEAQEAKLRQVAQEKYVQGTRIKIFKISASAYRGIPAKLKYISEIANRGDSILIYRVDRLTRNIILFLSVLEDLNNRGVNIHAVDENLNYSENRLQFIQGILDGQKESEIIGKRVKLSLEYRRKRGDENFGSVPYGKMSKREEKTNRLTTVDNPVEQAAIRRICEHKGPLSELVKEMNDEGLLKRGRKWTVSGCVRIRHNEGVAVECRPTKASQKRKRNDDSEVIFDASSGDEDEDEDEDVDMDVDIDLGDMSLGGERWSKRLEQQNTSNSRKRKRG